MSNASQPKSKKSKANSNEGGFTQREFERLIRNTEFRVAIANNTGLKNSCFLWNEGSRVSILPIPIDQAGDVLAGFPEFSPTNLAAIVAGFRSDIEHGAIPVAAFCGVSRFTVVNITKEEVEAGLEA